MEFMPSRTASMPDAQAHITVLPGTSSGMPAFSAAYLATLEKSEVCLHWPKSTSPISEGSMLALSMAAFMMAVARSALVNGLSEPPNLPTAVRQASTITVFSTYNTSHI